MSFPVLLGLGAGLVLLDSTSFGISLAMGSDLTGDGIHDLLIGAQNWDPDGAARAVPGLGE